MHSRHLDWLAFATLALTACNGGGTTTTTTDSTGAESTGESTGDATTQPPPTSDPTPGTTDQGTDSATGPTTTETTLATDPATSEPATSSPETTSPATSHTDDTGETGNSTGPGCGLCNQPNQACVDDVCVTLCQGQDPDPCGPDQVCDVISGECKNIDEPCVLAGAIAPCDAVACGPGSVCDGQGACRPIAPCAEVACTGDNQCWGTACQCDREAACQDPALDQLNGAFAVNIGGIDFSDECEAWMVTLRSGADYLRRLKPDGTLDEWTGVANLNMGEVKVLRALTVPQFRKPFGLTAYPAPPIPEGIGEVAITYTCCASCGCQADPPQGVARLDEANMMTPLPIVIAAVVTQGNGPFTGNSATAANAGPQGLTWGVDRVLYVGNSTANGVFNSADLMAMSQNDEFMFTDRVTASAPVSPVHLVVGLIGGEVHRFNVLTKQADFLLDLGADITGFSHDAFSGKVYAGLSTLEIAEFDPFTGEVATFGMMPGQGRVAVSPSGTLYYTPVKYLFPAGLITPFDLPDTF